MASPSALPLTLLYLKDFLNEIFYSIVRTELRMTESTSMDVSEQRLVELHQLSRTPRGRMAHAHAGESRHVQGGECLLGPPRAARGDTRRLRPARLRCKCASPRRPCPRTGRHLFDGRMFQLVWSPAVSAMCAIIDNVRSEAVVEAALAGLQLATTIAAAHQVDDVADVVMSSLAKVPMQVSALVGPGLRHTGVAARRNLHNTGTHSP